MHYLSVASAFIATFIFMIAFRPLAIDLGVVDRPGGRKTHSGDVPIVGGAAMFLGFVLAMALVPGLTTPYQYLVLSCGVLVLIGVLDDCFELPPLVRIVTQVLVVLIMTYGDGLIIVDIGDAFGLGTVSFGNFSWFFTLLVTVAVINAFNLVDGADGLAGSMAIISLTCVAIVAGVGSLTFEVALVAIAVIAAFLLFNFPMRVNRSIRSFMGDGGSTVLGFVIAWVTISVSQGEGRVVTPVVALWFASIPVYDLFTCFGRRLLQGKSPLVPDHQHFHHILKESGMGFRLTLASLTGLQAIYAGFGLLGHFAGIPDVYLFAAWAGLGIGQFKIISWLASAYRSNRTRKGDAGLQT